MLGLATSGAVIVLLPLGISTGIVACCCKIKSLRQSKEQTGKENIDLKENPVYEVVKARKSNVELNENPVYDVVM